MNQLRPQSSIAIIGPRPSFESIDEISDLAGGEQIDRDDRILAGDRITALLLDATIDPRFTELNKNAGNLGGLVVINYSYRYLVELDLSADPKVEEAARRAAEKLLPVFVNVVPTMGGLHLEGVQPTPEVVVFGNDLDLIKDRISSGVGVTT